MKLEPHVRCADAGGYACTCGADQRNEVTRLKRRIEKLENVALAALIATTRDKKPYRGSRLLLEADLMRVDKALAELEQP